MSLNEAQNAQISFDDEPTITITLVSIISTLILILSIYQLEDIYVPKMNIASSQNNEK